MIVLDYRDRRPLYEQVTERFEELMFQGILAQDDKLPSVRSLATELSINPNTIQRAYAELERQGYIYSVKGKGSFVADVGRIRRGMEEEWENAFEKAVREGFRIGITKEEMKKRLEEAAGKIQEERGTGDD
jgi:GntR family transcriptional regulator